jgi:hypothetical protein
MQINSNSITLQGLRKVQGRQIACKPSIFLISLTCIHGR